MKKLAAVFAITLLLISCGRPRHFISDRNYREQVHRDFLARADISSGRSEQLFSVFDRDISTEQREALEFLYAYMPLCDLAEYDGEYFLRQVDGALRARDFFEWGKSVPEDIFRHYVLVPRINNEYLDEARDVFFEELKDRISGLGMEQAALEVNHWCHEKVTYRATDPRTSSPLALAKTSWGRCGEESTFAGVALRAVGIPARQVYTPRWAHTDSNHAWIEVWVDGEWKYLGACEPEPELNVAWFSAPAKRMMMAHTSVMGLYGGDDEVSKRTPYYSTLNLLGNYADTRPLEVTVIDNEGRPVSGIPVSFSVINYAQQSPIAALTTDDNGTTTLTTGYGDLIVSAGRDDSYGQVVARAGENRVTLTLDRKRGEEYDVTFEVNVPREIPVEAISGAQVEANAVRLAYEDSLRNAYMATFPTEDYARTLAREHGLDPEPVWNALDLAEGNWKEIEKFIISNGHSSRLFPFLASLKDKDLRDTPAEFLDNHFNGSVNKPASMPEDIYVNYVLSPRIFIELIKPWRTYMAQAAERYGLESPKEIIDFIESEITVDPVQNYYACYLTPQGTDELKVADPRSRNIYFVAMCRALGIPARIEQATGKPQYWENGWKDAVFSDMTLPGNTPKNTLSLHSVGAYGVKPAYGRHYTLAAFAQGQFRPLDMKGEKALEELPAAIKLDTGYYRLTAVSRANDGSVTVAESYFNISADKPVTQKITLPEVEGKVFVKGIIDMNTIVPLGAGESTTLKELSRGKGLMICFADPAREPTRHVLQELPALRQQFERWGGGVLFMVPSDKVTPGFDPAVYKDLPATTTWTTDDNRALLNMALEVLQMDNISEFPLVMYLNTNGGILFSSEGYRIGIGESVLKIVMVEQN